MSDIAQYAGKKHMSMNLAEYRVDTCLSIVKCVYMQF